MTAMTCPEAEELLGAYALDAVTDDEASRMEEHLASCQEHAAAAAVLRKTRSLLALTADEAEPSAELRWRIIQAVKVTQPAQELRPAPVVVPIRRIPRMPRWAPRPAYFAVAAALLVALGIGGLLGYRLSQNGQPVAFLFHGDPQKAPGAEARLVYFKDRKQAVLVVSRLPRLTAGHVYEVWLIKGGVPVDEGISADPNGTVGIHLSGDITQYQELAVTIEPGEQKLPTTVPILIGNL